MSIPIKITFRNIDASPAVEAKVREGAEKLEHFDTRIQWCNVAVEGVDKHKHKGGLYRVSINLGVPGKTLQVNRAGPKNAAHSDIYVAIRDAFNAAVRQVEDHVRIRRDDVKSHETPLHGQVVRLFAEQDYGFIETSSGEEIYFHRNSVINNVFNALEVGSEVRLEVAYGESEKGPQATTVKPIGKHHIVG